MPNTFIGDHIRKTAPAQPAQKGARILKWALIISLSVNVIAALIKL